jgi:thioredoxin-related protein
MLAGYLRAREEPFFKQVALDQARESFISYGVNGTPTIVRVDPQGVIVYRQVGYNPDEGLAIEGWSWSRP